MITHLLGGDLEPTALDSSFTAEHSTAGWADMNSFKTMGKFITVRAKGVYEASWIVDSGGKQYTII